MNDGWVVELLYDVLTSNAMNDNDQPAEAEVDGDIQKAFKKAVARCCSSSKRKPDGRSMGNFRHHADKLVFSFFPPTDPVNRRDSVWKRSVEKNRQNEFVI